MLSNNEFSNVYDLSASRKIKQSTGQSRAVKKTAPDSPEMVKHEDEALAIHKAPAVKKSLFDKTMDYLGMSSE